MTFPCDQCGLCCRSLDNSLYGDLNRGDGVCRYLDESTNQCTVYDNRPLKCRIDDMFHAHYKNEYSLTEYYALNHQACNQLKEKEKI